MINRKLAFTGILVIFIITLLEITGQVMISRTYGYSKMRMFLLGKSDTDNLPRLTAHPYLNYICTPNYSQAGYQWHNKYGYRGDTVPFFRDSTAYRILFLGGSTTYSYFIERTENTFPEQVAKLMMLDTAWHHFSSGKYKTAEVINGGLPAGTSLELLTHYLFKYKYFRPDLVVIHTGGNDSFSYYEGGPYQPDYSHWRLPFDDIKPMPAPFRRLLHSRFLSFFIIRVFYPGFNDAAHFQHTGEKMITDWFRDSTFLTNPDANAFYNNIETLIREIRANGSEALLVPFIANKDWPNLAPEYLAGIDRNAALLKELSGRHGVAYCDITPEIITKENWKDDCHLNEAGEIEKARAVSRCIINMMESTGNFPE